MLILKKIKPNGARVYNYAFSQSDNAKGKADTRDPDGDFYESIAFQGGSWSDLGTYTTKKGHCEFTGAYDRKIILPSVSDTYTAKKMKQYISNFFKKNMTSYVKSDFDVCSDTLIFPDETAASSTGKGREIYIYFSIEYSRKDVLY